MLRGNSVIETLWFQWYFIRPKTAEGNITWTLVQISLRSNITRCKANKTGVVPVRIQRLGVLFFCQLSAESKLLIVADAG